MLVKNLMKKVGDGEEQYSLLKEQNDSYKELLVTERAQFEEKESMYKQNVRTSVCLCFHLCNSRLVHYPEHFTV